MAPGAMPTESRAFDALLLGRHMLERRSPDAVEGATRAFRDAIRADSGYAPGYAGLSSAYVLHVVYGFPGGGNGYVAIQRARRPLPLYPLSTGVRHSTIAIALGARQYDLALEEARRARAFDPSDQTA